MKFDLKSEIFSTSLCLDEQYPAGLCSQFVFLITTHNTSSVIPVYVISQYISLYCGSTILQMLSELFLHNKTVSNLLTHYQESCHTCIYNTYVR